MPIKDFAVNIQPDQAVPIDVGPDQAQRSTLCPDQAQRSKFCPDKAQKSTFSPESRPNTAVDNCLDQAAAVDVCPDQATPTRSNPQRIVRVLVLHIEMVLQGHDDDHSSNQWIVIILLYVAINLTVRLRVMDGTGLVPWLKFKQISSLLF